MSIGNDQTSLPVGYRPYLPGAWAQDPDLRQKGGMAGEIRGTTKWQIGLDLIDEAMASDRPLATVLADAGNGDALAFRIERPASEAEPITSWLPTLPADVPIAGLVRQAKARWRMERDYQERNLEGSGRRGQPLRRGWG